MTTTNSADKFAPRLNAIIYTGASGRKYSDVEFDPHNDIPRYPIEYLSLIEHQALLVKENDRWLEIFKELETTGYDLIRDLENRLKTQDAKILELDDKSRVFYEQLKSAGCREINLESKLAIAVEALAECSGWKCECIYSNCDMTLSVSVGNNQLVNKCMPCFSKEALQKIKGERG